MAYSKMAVTPIDPPYPKTPCCPQTLVSMCYRTGVIDEWSFTLGRIGILDVFCSRDRDLDPITFIYELDQYFVEVYRMSRSELPTSRLSKVIVWQTDKQDRDYILRRFAGGQQVTNKRRLCQLDLSVGGCGCRYLCRTSWCSAKVIEHVPRRQSGASSGWRRVQLIT